MKAPSRAADSPGARLRARLRRESEEACREEFGPRVVAELDGSRLQSNYRAVAALVPGQEILPMLKADAYGHGAVWAARLLTGLPGLYGLGVATLEEGREIREELGARERGRVIVFSGATLWDDAKGRFCERFGLTPVIASEEDWHRFRRGGWPARLSYELEFNTGMNRLGLDPGLAPRLVRELGARPALEHPAGVFSHLAMAEAPDAPLSRQQLAAFRAVRGEFEASLPAVRFHLANSAAIWNARRFELDALTDAVRPGLALYGVPPAPGASARGIAPVMTLKAAVVQTRTLKPGDRLGYGGDFRVTAEDGRVRVGILGAGYADGVDRGLGGRGVAWLNGRATRFLGRVSMDLAAVESFAGTKAGDWVELLGPHVDPWAQAAAAGTVPYELLTSVSPRVQKRYV